MTLGGTMLAEDATRTALGDAQLVADQINAPPAARGA